MCPFSPLCLERLVVCPIWWVEDLPPPAPLFMCRVEGTVCMGFEVGTVITALSSVRDGGQEAMYPILNGPLLYHARNGIATQKASCVSVSGYSASELMTQVQPSQSSPKLSSTSTLPSSEDSSGCHTIHGRRTSAPAPQQPLQCKATPTMEEVAQLHDRHHAQGSTPPVSLQPSKPHPSPRAQPGNKVLLETVVDAIQGFKIGPYPTSTQGRIGWGLAHAEPKRV